MTRLKQAWLALFLILLVGCVPADRRAKTVLVCRVQGVETYRSDPEKCWTSLNGGRWVNCDHSKAYSQSVYESCIAGPEVGR